MRRKTRSQRTITPARASQQTIVEEDNNDELDDEVNKCVRYFIYRSGSNEPIRKIELKKNVLTNVGRRFDSVVKKAGEILDKVMLSV